MSDTTTKELKKHLGQLSLKSMNLFARMYQLQNIREKLEVRTLKSFDKEDILSELGSIQYSMKELNSEMLKISDLLKKS
ncbi:MAG: hypothetical protein ACK40G_17220 [Cytophagaceae bacterium]